MWAEIRKYIGPPIFADNDKTDFAAILRALFITLLVISPVVLVVGLLMNNPKYVWGVIITDLVVLGALWLLRRGFITVVSLLLPLVLLLLAMYFVFVGHRLNDTALLMFPLVIILSGLLLGRAGVVFFTLVAVLYTFFIFYAEKYRLISCCNYIVGLDNVVAIMVILATTAIIFELLSRRLSAALAQSRRNEQALIEANRQLEQQERQYRVLYHHSPIMMDSVNSQGQLVSVNEHWLETMGYRAEEVIGQNSIEFLTEESRRYATELVIPQLLKTGRVNDVAYQFVKKNGEVIDVLLTATAYRDEQGNFSHALAVIRDVTEQKQAEQALRESEAKLRLIYENAYDGISIYEELPNRSRRLIDCNERYAEIAGRSKEELLRIGNTSLVQKKVSLEMTLEEILRVRRESTPYHGLFSWIRPDGKENIIEYSAAPIQVGDHPWTIGLDRDITEHSQITEKLRENEARLKTIINQIPFDLWVCGVDGRYTMQNAMSYDLAGDLIGKTIDDLDITPEIRSIYKEKHLRALSGQTVREELEVLVKGQPRILESVQAPIRDGERVLGLIGMRIDITERVQAEERLRLQTAQLEALRQIGLELAAKLDLESLLQSIVARAQTLLNGHRGGIFLYQPDLQALEMVATSDPTSPIPLGALIKPGEGLTGQTWQSGQTIMINDYPAWQEKSALLTRLIASGVTASGSIISTPVRGDNEILGVLNVTAEAKNHFSPADAELLSLFAAQAAVAIHNARLHEQIQAYAAQLEQEVAERKQAEQALQEYSERLEERVTERTAELEAEITERKKIEETLRRRVVELEVVAQVSTAASTILDRPLLLQTVVELTRDHFKLSHVHIGLLNEAGNVLRMVASADEIGRQLMANSPLLYLNRDRSLATLAATTRQCIVVNDVSQEPNYLAHPLLKAVQSEMVVPMFVGERLIGVIAIQSNQLNRFRDEDVAIHKILAAQVAVAVENARRFEELQQTILQLQETQERLTRQEKLAVLGQLAGSVGHELRNPLGVINNALYFLNMVLSDAEETVKEYLDLIASRVNEADKIVADLLNLSRTHVTIRQGMAVSSLVLETLQRHPPPEAVTVVTHMGTDLPLILVDSQQISQVLANLVTNAYQGMPNGGALTISTDSEPTWVKLSVADTGVGIASGTMEKIFEPLYTTKAKGIGLGLAVSKNLVEVNGGTIEVESTEGQGAIFTITLPISANTEKVL
jgi:two-component system, NtrC family, sensor histidine kinase HydH